jgi:nitroreductase
MTPYQKRYGGLPVDTNVVPNEFIENLLGRSTQRKFNGKPLDPGVLELLIAAAQSAPSSGMLQTWSVIALTTPEEKAKLFATTQASPSNTQIIGGIDSHNMVAIKSSAVVLIWLADLSRLKVILDSVEVDDRTQSQPTFAEYHLKAIVDATIAAQTFYMAAETMGILGTYCGAIRQLPIEFLEKEFNLPKYTFPVFGTIHGYCDIKDTTVKPRLPNEIVLHHGTYNKVQSVDEFQKYNTVHTRNISTNVSSYESRVVERLKPTYTKEYIGDSLRHMGFDFK